MFFDHSVQDFGRNNNRQQRPIGKQCGFLRTTLPDVFASWDLQVIAEQRSHPLHYSKWFWLPYLFFKWNKTTAVLKSLNCIKSLIKEYIPDKYTCFRMKVIWTGTGLLHVQLAALRFHLLFILIGKIREICDIRALNISSYDMETTKL